MKLKCRHCSQTFRSGAGRAGHEHYKHKAAREAPAARKISKARVSERGPSGATTAAHAAPRNGRALSTSRQRPARRNAGVEVRFCPSCQLALGALAGTLDGASIQFCPACGCAVGAVRRALAAASEARS